MTLILPILSKAKSAGLALTLHIAEVRWHLQVYQFIHSFETFRQTTANSAEETMALLSSLPSRLGHATFLGPEAEKFAAEHRMGIEICLSSNLLWVRVDGITYIIKLTQ
jgi:adenosine deaminase